MKLSLSRTAFRASACILAMLLTVVLASCGKQGAASEEEQLRSEIAQLKSEIAQLKNEKDQDGGEKEQVKSAKEKIQEERDKIMKNAVRVRLIKMKTDVSGDEKLQESDIEMFETMRFAGAANTLEIPWERRNDVIGMPLRSLVRAGDILTWRDFSQIISKSRTGLPSQTESGLRAVSIPVSSVTSVSGLIRPNNYVDVIGTFHFPDAMGDPSLDTVTMTILQRVKVLATGSDLGYATQNDEQSNALPEAKQTYSTVTLELTPKEAEMIVFAQQKGSLSLTLRNYDDSAITSDVQSVDWSYLQEHIKDYMKERELLLKKKTGY